uniref:FAS1 domain-containing protein n=2 Tax=Rhodnius prolixus TaxID=13249 RepID=T1HGZ9_RHOPR
MTGVSLAGTQLRVNTYATQDQEWNDIKVLTVNGARILIDKSDLRIPQGVAHTVDRVMFPLPVGDVLQTLMSDRENRFSKFIRLLQETGVAQSLQGTKSYTVFAPTDSAFTDGELERLLEEGEAARALALKHITPGTLYSAGMLYYQLRESMSPPNQIQLSKEAGRVKVNNAHVVSRNIPATNGVVHAIDSLL